MCGFLGAYTFKENIGSWVPKLCEGLELIKHRGPDAGKYVTSENTFSGHRRLSIIDLSSTANQPLFSSHADAHIIFNGEIYNYRELKQGLREKTSFETLSDTEVILEGYLVEGVDFFSKLRGIYAFSIFDNRRGRKRIVLARDPSGIKPIYYYHDSDIFLFGSEIKALLPCIRGRLTINENAIKAYLNLSYIPEPFTAYKDIRALEPGHVLMVEDGKASKCVFYDFDFQAKNNNLTFEHNALVVEEKLREAVSRNLVADVEVAVALSGGIDSSLIYAYANEKDPNIKGLTARFSDGEYDETELATSYAEAVTGEQIIFDVENDFSLEVLDKILIHFDQPYADSSAIPVYYLTKNSALHTKVIIGGDGGDELFNGYPSQIKLANIHQYNSNPLMSVLLVGSLGLLKWLSSGATKRGLQRIKDLAENSPAEMLYDWHSWFPRKTRFEGNSPFSFNPNDGFVLYDLVFKDQEPQDFTQQIVFDYYKKNMLSDYLRKADMMSMMNHVEYRVPLLDEDFVDLALRIPFKQKSTLKETKRFLRYLHRKIYPPQTSKAPKHGFCIPLDVYLSKEEYARMREAVTVKSSYVNNFIRPQYVRFLFDALQGKQNVSSHISRAGIYQRILMLYSLELWYSNN